VRDFVAREPKQRAGGYAEHSVWRFENLLGRTMWEFAGAVALAVQARDRGAVDALLEAWAGPVIEVHDWEFGGRR
jgi:hypothetical protein